MCYTLISKRFRNLKKSLSKFMLRKMACRLVPFGAVHRSQRSRLGGFNLVELLASILIIGVLSCCAIPYVADYISRVKYTADNATLVTLNNAIHTYEVLGGDLTALTEGAPIDHIIERLKTPLTVGGVNRPALIESFTYPARSLSAEGNYMRYRFSKVNTYQQP